MNPYKTLGVGKDDDLPDIKKSFRRKAQASHPDQNGGEDSGEFHQITRAWAILSDPQKRAEYDSTGTVDEKSLAEKAMARLESLFLGLLELEDQSFDAIEVLQDTVDNYLKSQRQEIAKNRAKIRRLEKSRKRLRTNNPENIYRRLADNKIAEFKQLGTRMDHRIEVELQVLELIKAYVDYGPAIDPSLHHFHPATRATHNTVTFREG